MQTNRQTPSDRRRKRKRSGQARQRFSPTDEVYYSPSARGEVPQRSVRTTAQGQQRRTAHPSAVRQPQATQKRQTVQRRPVKRKGSSIWRSGLLGDIRLKFDTPLLMITLMLLGSGLIALMSASYPTGYYNNSDNGPLFYISRQSFAAVLGLIAMFFVSAFDYHRYHVLGKGLYLLSAIFLVLVLTPLGQTHNNATRWIFGFQPSELAKLAIILTFSSFVSVRPEKIRSVRGLLPYIAAMSVYIFLLYKEPHMSAALIIVVIGFSILFIGGMRLWYFIPIGVIGVIGGIFSYFTLNHIQERINIFLNPFLDAQNTGYQAVQSLIAIGSGGLFGLGLGQSRQKFMYLPEPMNDFIFSVICEELGFIGASLFLVMFAYFIYRGYSIARRAEDRFGALLAVGITTQFAFQILLNLAVVSGLFPVTGVSLPLFSYGGTALVMQLLEIGILLNISRHIPPSRQE